MPIYVTQCRLFKENLKNNKICQIAASRSELESAQLGALGASWIDYDRVNRGISLKLLLKRENRRDILARLLRRSLCLCQRSLVAERFVFLSDVVP